MATEAQKRPGKKEGEDDVFMMSYTALMILLLTFMIVMVTLSTFKEPRFRRAIGSVRGALSFLPHSGGDELAMTGHSGVLPEEALAKGLREESLKDKEYRETVQSFKGIAKKPTFTDLEVLETNDGLAIRIWDALMFPTGDADIYPEVLPVLDLVARIAEIRPGKVSVVGHTCDLPIATAQYPSNWELSIARAISVVRYLNTRGVPADSLFAYGVADTRPLVPNTSRDNRQKNRRVEIYISNVLKRREGSDGEPRHGPYRNRPG
jgi:chemotaxis protein MotB